ncbi:MAG: hypothetical protein AAGE38_05230 [Pseudomonadota bacterium]
MTILTAMLVIVGVGAVLQRGENGSSLLGSGGSFQSNPDTFALRAGRVQSLDVLLNDQNVDRVSADDLTIVKAPSCGVAQVVGGAIQYSESQSCLGEVAMAYCVPWDGSCRSTDVTLDIVRVNPDNTVVSSSSGPAVVDVVAQGAAPQDTTQVVLAQPRRLKLPATAEVITPSEATADVRAIAREAGPSTVVASDTAEAAVSVSTASARSGSVGVVGATMDAPQVAEESSGIQIASISAPEGVKPKFIRPNSAPLMTQLGDTPPRSEVAFEPPSRPDAAPVVVMESLDPLPNQAQADAGGQALPDPTDLDQVVVAETAPTPATLPVSTPQAPTNTAGGSNGVAPATLSAKDVVVAAEDAPATQEVPATLNAEAVIETPTPAPVVAELPLAVTPRPATAPEDEPEQDQVELALALPQSEPVPVAPKPVVVEPEAVEAAPEAQVNEPAPVVAPVVEASPDSSGVLASLARSNTVFGATVSAAKALFAPTDPRGTVNHTPSGTSAPRPRELTDVTELGAASLQNRDSIATLSIGAGTRQVRPASSQSPRPVVVASLNPDGETFLPGSEAPAPGRVVAALAPEPSDEPVSTATLDIPDYTSQNSITAAQCDIDLALQVKVGAEMVASLSSYCRPEETFIVEHAGLHFSAETDEDGVANFVVPALMTNATVRVTFPDGKTAVDRAVVEGMSNMTRVAMVWTAENDFNLHARELNVGSGAATEIWSGNASTYRLARRTGNGYLTMLGPLSGPGVKAEVYTLFETPRTKTDVIEFDVRLGETGSCVGAPVVRVLRSELAEIVRNTDIRLDLAGCTPNEPINVGFGLRDIAIANSQ